MNIHMNNGLLFTTLNLKSGNDDECDSSVRQNWSDSLIISYEQCIGHCLFPLIITICHDMMNSQHTSIKRMFK